MTTDNPNQTNNNTSLEPVTALGVDLGTKRIGIAKSDPGGVLASPLCVLKRKPKAKLNHAEIQEIVVEWEVDVVVVGLPLSLDGSVGRAAQKVLREVKAMGDTMSVPVETYDERLTTVTAQGMLRDVGTSAKDQRDVVDMVAAAVFLQSWLDRRRSVHHHGDTPAGTPPT